MSQKPTTRRKTNPVKSEPLEATAIPLLEFQMQTVAPKVHVYELTPFATEGETFAQAMNRNMQLLGENDYAIIRDHDTLFTTNDWYPRIVKHITGGMQFGTCYTNRIFSGFQIAPDAPQDDDIRNHWAFGDHLSRKYDGQRLLIDTGKRMSGMLMVISKKHWNMIWPLATETILQLDNEIHTKMEAAGIPLHLMQDVYVYHRYRFGNRSDTSHLQPTAPEPATAPNPETLPVVASQKGTFRKVCYTVITGEYEQLIQPVYQTRDWEYILYTDRPENYPNGGGIWQIKKLENPNQWDDRTLQRHAKVICPEKPEKGQLLRTIYVDGNQAITGNLDYLTEKVGHILGGITSKQHPDRDCVYEEANAVLLRKKDDEKHVRKAVRMVKTYKYPEHGGFSETGVLIRDYKYAPVHTKVTKAMSHWWGMMKEGSMRDQLSFDVVMSLSMKKDFTRAEAKHYTQVFNKQSHSGPIPANVPRILEPKTVKEATTEPFNERFELNIFTTARPDQIWLIPHFIANALKHNPQAHVEIWMTDREPTPDLTELQAYWPGQMTVRQHLRMRDEANGHFTSARFFLQPSVKTRYVYMPSIEMQITDAILPAMLNRMKETGLRYSNAWRLNTDDRMLTDHFTEYEAFWPHRFSTEEHSVRDMNTELLLGRIVLSKNPPPTETDRPAVARPFTPQTMNA